MKTVFVRAGGHVVRALQTLVDINFHVRRNIHHRAERTRLGTERSHAFFRSRRPDQHRAGFGGKLGFIQLVVTADQNQNRFTVRNVNQRLDLAIGGNFVGFLAQRLDSHDAPA